MFGDLIGSIQEKLQMETIDGDQRV